MRLRHLGLVLVVLLVPTPAQADDHFADMYGGIRYMKLSSAYGFHAQLALRPSDEVGLSIVSDLGFDDGRDGRRDVTKVSALLGLRQSLPRVKNAMPFVQVLTGAIATDGGENEGNKLAVAVGGGLEFGLGAGFTTRDGHSSTRWAVRGQADFIYLRRGSTGVRLSAGIVYRFRRPQPKEP